MTPTRTRIRDVFPTWTLSQCAAYRDGIRDMIEFWEIDEFLYLDDREDDLRQYYLRGAADALGSNATGEDWFSEIVDWSPRRWWDSEFEEDTLC